MSHDDRGGPAPQRIRGGVKQEVVAWHLDTHMRDFRLGLFAVDVIPTRGLMSGANADVRVCAELVATFKKPA